MPGNQIQFASVFKNFVNNSGYNLRQLAELSGISVETIRNWYKGRVRKPRSWHDLVKLASVLHLNEPDATKLLESASYPSLPELLITASVAEDIELLSPWAEEVHKKLEQAPFQAIADLPYFVGREEELEKIKEAIRTDHHITLYSMEGMPGVGKTVLAARIAYQLRPHFPDGVLWAQLDTTSTMAILGAFADAYDRDVSMFTDLEARSQVVRKLLADKRVLIVLDNARHSKEVRPLLPPTGTCAVIVTTRRLDLSVTQGTRRFLIQPFDVKKRDAFELFSKILGTERAQAEEVALSEIADLLGHLPLAIGIAASRLAYEPDWEISGYLERVRQEKRRLDELEYEDVSVRISFNLSYDILEPELQLFFASLGVFGGEDFSVVAAAFANEMQVEGAQDNLRKLYGLSLVQGGRPGRYRLHLLLRDYAREKITTEEVYQRMVSFFVNFLQSHKRDFRALELEMNNISAALNTAFEKGMQANLIQGTNLFYFFLEVRGLYELADFLLNRAHESVKFHGDDIGFATVLLNLSQLAEKRGDYAKAEDHLLKGLTLTNEHKYPVTASTILATLGLVAARRGFFEDAESYYQKGLGIARLKGDNEIISILLERLGSLRARKGNLPEAEEHFLEGLTLARKIGDQERVGNLLQNLGALASNQGDYNQAEKWLREGLAIAQGIKHQERISDLLNNLGLIAKNRGDLVLAEKYLQDALSVARTIGHAERISARLNVLGFLAEERAEYEQAEKYYQEGFDIARDIGNSYLMSELLEGLGIIATKRGNYTKADQYLQESLTIAQEGKNTWLSIDIKIELAELYLKKGDLSAAETTLEEARKAAKNTEFHELFGDATFKLAQVRKAQGNTTEAKRLGQESLVVFKTIENVKAAEVEDWLDRLLSS